MQILASLAVLVQTPAQFRQLLRTKLFSWKPPCPSEWCKCGFCYFMITNSESIPRFGTTERILLWKFLISCSVVDWHLLCCWAAVQIPTPKPLQRKPYNGRHNHHSGRSRNRPECWRCNCHLKRRLSFFHHRCAQRTELQCNFLLIYGFQPDRCPDFRQLPANLSDSVRWKAVWCVYHSIHAGNLSAIRTRCWRFLPANSCRSNCNRLHWCRSLWGLPRRRIAV